MLRWILILLLASLITFAPAVRPAMAEAYKLRNGDILHVEVLEDSTLSRSLLIAPDGRISMPMAGGIQAAGRTLEAVQADLIAKLAHNFATSPTVFLSLERQAEPRPVATVAAKDPVILVYVMGEANKPGRLELAPGTTALQAFAQMGGFSKFAATKRIQIRRGSERYSLNYKKIEEGSSDSGDLVLREGDVIVVPQRRLFE